MKLPKILFYRSDSNDEIVDDAALRYDKNINSGRRRQDAMPKTANKMVNLDRRAANSDRRINDDPSYNGPSRRYTIDRRMNLKDRREEN